MDNFAPISRNSVRDRLQKKLKKKKLLQSVEDEVISATKSSLDDDTPSSLHGEDKSTGGDFDFKSMMGQMNSMMNTNPAMINTLSKSVSDILNNKNVMSNLISKVTDTIKQSNPELEKSDFSEINDINFTPEFIKETIDKNILGASEEVIDNTNNIMNSKYMEKLTKDLY